MKAIFKARLCVCAFVVRDEIENSTGKYPSKTAVRFGPKKNSSNVTWYMQALYANNSLICIRPNEDGEVQ